MVRGFIDALRLPATNRQGPTQPEWNGDEAKWALDSCLSGQYRCVSFPGATVLKPKTAPGGSEVLPAIEVAATTAGRQQPGRSAAVPHSGRHQERAQGFCLPDRADAERGRGNSRRQGAGSDQRVGAGQIARTNSLNIADALQQHVPGIIVSDTTGNPFSRTFSFAVLSHLPSPALRRDSRFIRTGCASTKRSATPSIGT